MVWKRFYSIRFYKCMARNYCKLQMKNKKIIPLLSLLIVFVCGLKFWADNSSSDLDPEIELAFDFSIALQYNYPEAYNLIDPNLKPQLDQWMSTHQSRECKHPYDVSLIGTGTNQGNKITLGCYGNNGWISFEVDDIVIKDMKVTDWGEIKEED